MLAKTVIQEIIQNPALKEYLVAFQKGECLCTEGDASKDLFILLSGKLALFKGDKKITEIAEAGTPVGEISFLLQAKRTATVKAASEVKALCIPQIKLERFLKEFPALMWHISEVLARRLDSGTQAWHALKEFCDSIADAVVAAAKDGRITTWNQSAEALFGRSWEQMQGAAIETLYHDPGQYRQALAALEKSDVVKEKVFVIEHPRKGLRYISSSLNFLYDGKHEFSGVLALSRDVTELEKIKRSYRRIRYWMLPLLLAIGLVVSASFLAVPYFKDGKRITDIKHQALRDRIASDYFLLQSLVSEALAQGNNPQIDLVIQKFAQIRRATSEPYLGLVLLGNDKKVVSAYSISKQKMNADLIGSSYAEIPFEAVDDSAHSVLSLYWSNERATFGQKGIELAFVINNNKQPAGWLIFQMDTELLFKEYAVDEAVLKSYKF